MNHVDVIRNEATQAIRKVCAELSVDSAGYLPPAIEPNKLDRFGHYRCDAAMLIARESGPDRKGPDIARRIREIWDSTKSDAIERIEVGGPGFVNITLSAPFISRELTAMARDSRLGVALPAKPLRVVIDFSSPNIAKELHVGHLRSTIIGDTLARLFEFLGHDVLRLNHIGDWGTQFGMLIAYINLSEQGTLSEETDLHSLTEWYKEAKARCDGDPAFKEEARSCVVALQRGDPAANKIWHTICAISRRGFEKIYEFLGVRLTERGESFYQPFLEQIVTDAEKQGVLEVSDGAKCLFIKGYNTEEGKPQPLILQKADGGYNYTTTDMAAIWHRVVEEKADKILYVVDGGQSRHFEMVFKGAEILGYLPPEQKIAVHVPFGVVLDRQGRKLKSRSGEATKLTELLQEGVGRTEEMIEKRKKTNTKIRDMGKEETQHLVHVLAKGAIKYADLSCRRTQDYQFSYDRMLRFEGNTAAFLLYAYVRIRSIRALTDLPSEEGEPSSVQPTKPEEIALARPEEIALGLHLLRFPVTLRTLSDTLLPNCLTDYLHALATKTNAFHGQCRVRGVPEQSSRLALCEITERVLKKGLEILGLETVDKM